MKYGLFSGILWGLDTVVLGIALSMSPYIGTAEAIAFAAIASSFLHDACSAIWLMLYMGAKRRLRTPSPRSRPGAARSSCWAPFSAVPSA